MSVIYLIRHGQASFFADDYDALSQLGHRQADLLGQGLAARHISPKRIVHGSMLRHRQTHDNAVQHLAAVPAEQDERWNEYPHQDILGVMEPHLATPALMREYLANEEQPMKTLQTLFFKAMTRWTQNPDSDAYQENWSSFSERVLSAFDHCAQHQEKPQLVFTSGGPISVVACHLLGLPLTDFMRINWTLVNGGITKIVMRGHGKASLSTLNSHDIFDLMGDKSLITYG